MSRFRYPSHSSFWSVDVDANVASHVSGFVARIQPLPMTAMDLRSASDLGLSAVATVSASDGRWAVLADPDARARAAEWFREAVEAEPAEVSLRRLACDGAEAWLEARATEIANGG